MFSSHRIGRVQAAMVVSLAAVLVGVVPAATGAQAAPSSPARSSAPSATPEVAGPPAAPRFAPNSAGVTVFWEAPASAETITGYSIQYKEAGRTELPWTNKPAPATPTNLLLTGLQNGISYEVQVAAVTASGLGAYSASGFVRPGVAVYTANPTLSGTPAVGSTLTVVDPDSNWSSPDGSPLVASYQWLSDGIEILGATSKSFVVTPTQAGTSVAAKVSRTNNSGHVSVNTAAVAIPLVFATYVPLAPVRLLDTRDSGVKLTAGSVRQLHVAGTNGVPADATAVVLNVTTTESEAPGFETVYPCGGAVPTASNVNWVAGQTIPNRVIASLDGGGNVCLFSYATTHLVVDLNGAYSQTAGTSPLLALAPYRLLDTREVGAKAGAGKVQELQVTGVAGVPADATAVVLNVTATRSTAPGFVTVFPCGGGVPTASNVNFVAGQTISNSVTATVGAGGKVCLFTYATTDLVVDLNAAYSPASGTGRFAAGAPHRLLDTRDAGVKTGAGTVQQLQVTGANGVPANATAVVLNVTSTESNGPGFVTVFPCGSAVPTASNVNYDEGQTIPISVTATVGAGGKVCLFTYSSTHLVVDLNGSYVPLA